MGSQIVVTSGDGGIGSDGERDGGTQQKRENETRMGHDCPQKHTNERGK